MKNNFILILLAMICGVVGLSAQGTITGAGTYNGTTIGAGNDCATRASTDYYYAFTPTVSGTWGFSLCSTATSWDSYLYVTTANCGGTTVASNDDGCVPLSTLTATLTAGTTYYILIEGWGSTDAGAFSLVVTAPPPPPATCSSLTGFTLSSTNICSAQTFNVTLSGCNIVAPQTGFLLVYDIDPTTVPTQQQIYDALIGVTGAPTDIFRNNENTGCAPITGALGLTNTGCTAVQVAIYMVPFQDVAVGSDLVDETCPVFGPLLQTIQPAPDAPTLTTSGCTYTLTGACPGDLITISGGTGTATLTGNGTNVVSYTPGVGDPALTLNISTSNGITNGAGTACSATISTFQTRDFPNIDLLATSQCLNGASDPFTVNTFSQTGFTVNFTADEYENEITWQLTNGSNTVIATNPAFVDNNAAGGASPQAPVTIYVNPATGPFTFTVFDSYGDGIIGGDGLPGGTGFNQDGSFSIVDLATGATLGTYNNSLYGSPGGTTTGNIVPYTISGLNPTVSYSYGTLTTTAGAGTLTAITPTGATASNGNSSFNPATAGVGTWNVTYSYTPFTGCTTNETVAITVYNTTATITGNNTICSGASTTLIASGGGTYLWSNAATTTTINVSPTATTTYTVTVTNNGCTATASRTVTVNTTPTISISPAAPAACSTALTASGGSTYVWSTTATTATISVPQAGGTFTVTGTAANGCSATASSTVAPLTNPSASITPSTAILCVSPATTASLTASGGGTYSWSGGSPTNVATTTVSTSGTYTVTVTAANGCSATASSVVSNSTLTASIAQAAPSNCQVVLTATAGSPSGAVTYTWSGGGNTATKTVTTNGTYTVTITDAVCSVTASVNVSSLTAPTATVSPSSANICIATSTFATLTASGGGTYSWSNGSPTNAAATTASTAGTYIVTVTGTNGCVSTASAVVANNCACTLSGSIAQAAPSGCQVVLTATAGSPSGAVTYAWSGGGNASTKNVTANGTYTVTITDAVCSVTASVNVSSLAAPTVNITPSSPAACATTLTASGAASYVWSNGPTSASISVPQAGGSFTVVGTAANGCTASNSATVNPLVIPTITINPASATVCPATLTTASLTASGAATYVWSTGFVSSTTTVNTPGVVTVTGTSVNGCTSTQTANVTQVCSCSITAANMTVSTSCAAGFWTVTFNPTHSGAGTSFNVTGTVSGSGTYGTPLVLNIPIATASASFTITDSADPACTLTGLTANKPNDVLTSFAYNPQAGTCVGPPQITLPAGYTCTFTYLSGQGACTGTGSTATYCVLPANGSSGTVQFDITTACGLSTQVTPVSYSCLDCQPNNGTWGH